MSESSLRVREASEKEAEATLDRHQRSQRRKQNRLRGQVYARGLKIIACRKRNNILILHLGASTSSVSSADRPHMTLP